MTQCSIPTCDETHPGIAPERRAAGWLTIRFGTPLVDTPWVDYCPKHTEQIDNPTEPIQDRLF